MLRIFAEKDECNCVGVKGVENIAVRNELSGGPCTPAIAGRVHRIISATAVVS